MPEDVKVPLIFERPFLSTAHAKIDVFKRKITLRVGNEKIIFKSVKHTSSLIKRVYMLSLRERMGLDLEARLMGETLILNRSLDPLYGDYIELNDLNMPLELRRNQADDLEPTIEEGDVIDKLMIDIVKTRDDNNMFYNSIMKDKVEYNGRNVLGTFVNAPIFVGNFSIVTDFTVVENMDAYRDEGMGKVIVGESFCKASYVEARRFDGMITIFNGNGSVTYQMVRSHPRSQYGDLTEKEETTLVEYLYSGILRYGESVPAFHKKPQRIKDVYAVMAALVISISSDVSVESVGSSFPRVILIGSISVEVPVAPEVGAAAVASPAGVLELDTHSSSEADPSESSPPPVSVAPMVSPFLCSDDSESDTEIPERHVSPTPHDAMLTRWRSRVASRSSSPTTSTLEIPTAPILPAPSAIVAPSSEFPLAPVVAPFGICRRRAILIRPEEDILIGRLYRTHLGGPYMEMQKFQFAV
ncbi:hypothetical protein Tco_0876661 [Tanacetum coccineum]|uniref:Uncharacterized protein n=1 Tax=Tanacetum coccineum TaxID=301880 RepID=A0ABQ5BSV7_9ASTR